MNKPELKPEAPVFFSQHRVRAQSTALIDIVAPFLTAEQRAQVIEQWEMVCELNGWNFRPQTPRGAS